MKLKTLTIYLAIAIAGCLWIKHARQVSYEEGREYIPTQRELQTMLVSKGYDIGPKGIDGAVGPDTLNAWRMYEFDQYALVYFDPKTYVRAGQ